MIGLWPYLCSHISVSCRSTEYNQTGSLSAEYRSIEDRRAVRRDDYVHGRPSLDILSKALPTSRSQLPYDDALGSHWYRQRIAGPAYRLLRGRSIYWCHCCSLRSRTSGNVRVETCKCRSCDSEAGADTGLSHIGLQTCLGSRRSTFPVVSSANRGSE